MNDHQSKPGGSAAADEQTHSAGSCGSASCGCAGMGPMATEFFRRFGPPSSARQHFSQARLEFLKGLRAMIDAQIERQSQSPSRGARVNID